MSKTSAAAPHLPETNGARNPEITAMARDSQNPRSSRLDKEPAATVAVRESETRFRMLADNMSQLAWTCDPLGNVTWYNKRWLEYTGLTFEEMKGWNWSKVQHPAHVDRVVARVKHSADTGEEWEDTFPLLGKDGQYRWFLSRAVPVRDDDGNLVQWFGTNTDVTDQLLADEQVAQQARELRKSEERLRHANTELAQRVAELQTLNVDVQDSRRAALNLMEDAVQSRQAADTLNVALRESEDRLAKELAAMRQLQRVSALLIEGGDTDALYQKLVDVAVVIMRSDFASMQMYHPERGSGGELRLLAFRGFNPQAAKFWEWVRADSKSTCGAALRTKRRVIVPDVEKCDFMAGTDDLETYLQAGIHAVQTTPLLSRTGTLLGMISTHWRTPHTPTESELVQFDVLARQATDLIERKLVEQRQQLLLNELAHRGRNLLAVIQTIASRSLSGPRSLAEAREAFMQRIQALARSQTLLLDGAFEGASVADIIGLEFEAFAGRVKAFGPDVVLNPKAAQTFALLAHELATNASKYGALSQPGGRIEINWSIADKDGEARFKFQWQERGGPPVVPPTRRGFGRTLIEKAAAQDFHAEPRINYAPEGLSYEIDAPLATVTASGAGQQVPKLH